MKQKKHKLTGGATLHKTFLMFKTQLDFNFSGVTFKNQTYSDKVKVEKKMLMKIQKHNFKRKHKIEDDISTIRDLVLNFAPDEEVVLISKRFDSPNIINALLPEIRNIYIATWAITPAGIDALLKLVETGRVKEAWLILDKTHSYKWIFTSNAYDILKGKVKIKFCANHSKFIVIETETGVLNFVGSMNFSNNPRFENITIDKDINTFEFYRDFIKNVDGETL
jgi:hypothetical protein